jgi:hypothetical protein
MIRLGGVQDQLPGGLAAHLHRHRRRGPDQNGHQLMSRIERGLQRDETLANK